MGPCSPSAKRELTTPVGAGTSLGTCLAGLGQVGTGAQTVSLVSQECSHIVLQPSRKLSCRPGQAPSLPRQHESPLFLPVGSSPARLTTNVLSRARLTYRHPFPWPHGTHCSPTLGSRLLLSVSSWGAAVSCDGQTVSLWVTTAAHNTSAEKLSLSASPPRHCRCWLRLCGALSPAPSPMDLCYWNPIVYAFVSQRKKVEGPYSWCGWLVGLL